MRSIKLFHLNLVGTNHQTYDLCRVVGSGRRGANKLFGFGGGLLRTLLTGDYDVVYDIVGRVLSNITVATLVAAVVPTLAARAAHVFVAAASALVNARVVPDCVGNDQCKVLNMRRPTASESVSLLTFPSRSIVKRDFMCTGSTTVTFPRSHTIRCRHE